MSRQGTEHQVCENDLPSFCFCVRLIRLLTRDVPLSPMRLKNVESIQEEYYHETESDFRKN